MAAPAGPTGQRAVLLYAVLGLAVVAGVAAAFLLGASPAPPKPQAGELIISAPTYVWGILFLLPLGAGLAALFFRRATEGSFSPPARALVIMVVILLLGALFVYVYGRADGPVGLSVSIGSNSGTGSGVPTNNSSAPANGSGGGSGNGTVHGAALASFTLSPWIVLVVIAGISVCLVALSLPGVLSRVVDRRSRPRPPDRAEVRSALVEAATALDRGEDPRETVIRLYVRLLIGLAPRVGDLSVHTPEEIRRNDLVRLGVGVAAAEVLTRLFEEARYSSHPIGPDEAGRFREAVRQAELDLASGRAS